MKRAAQSDTSVYIAEFAKNERTLCTEVYPPLRFADRL